MDISLNYKHLKLWNYLIAKKKKKKINRQNKEWKNIYGKQLLDATTKTALDALKTASKKSSL